MKALATPDIRNLLLFITCWALALLTSLPAWAVVDSDEDGLSDTWELVYGFNPGGPNESAGDEDGDALTNAQEFEAGLNPLVSNIGQDSDNDNINDVDEVLLYSTHPLVPDSDMDGMPDHWELSFNLDPLDRTDAMLDMDSDGLKNIQEYQLSTHVALADSDGDGINDSVDNLPLNTYESIDTDSDGQGNSSDTDDDNDGITDFTEATNCIYGIWWNACTNSLKVDTDGDTINDLVEIQNGKNPVGHLPLLFFWVQGDLDSDGLPDDWEQLHELTNPASDTDGDSLTNLAEYQQGINPRATDSDGDGFADDQEILNDGDARDASDTVQMVMATGQSLAAGGGLNTLYPDPYDPAAKRMVTGLPAYDVCPYGFCLMFNTGSRGTGSDPVNTPNLPLTHFQDMMEGSATFGPTSCRGSAERSNHCDPREAQGPGMLKLLHSLLDESTSADPGVYMYRSHGVGGQLYNPLRDPAYNPASDPEQQMGLNRGSQAYENVFGPVTLPENVVDGELDSALRIAADPALSPWPKHSSMRERQVRVTAVTITHGETDSSPEVDNQEYDDDLREWIADYTNDIVAKTNQSSAPIFLLDQLSTSFYGGKGHKVQTDQMAVAEELPNVYLSAPKYQLPFLPDGVHLTAEGYHLLGEYHAKVLHSILSGVDWKPLQPQSLVLTGNVIDVGFHVPEGNSIILDTAACNRVNGPEGEYENLHGFHYDEGDGSGNASGIKIQSVVIVGSNVVRITLNGVPDMADDPRIQYAYDSTGNVSCGSLRDNFAGQQVSTLPVGSEHYGRVLHNWAVVFNLPMDSDGDGLPDGWETQYGLNPLQDDSGLDSDSDGLTNQEEFSHHSNPIQADTDADGLTDGDEVNNTETLPYRADTDDDGLGDGYEFNVSLTNPLQRDTDNDGVIDGQDAFPLNPLESIDTDNDGVGNNTDTDDDNDGVQDGSDACPLDSLGFVGNTDLDDWCDEGSDTDDDNDGIPDVSDARPLDTDNDGANNSIDVDDDNDGMPDTWEITYGLNPLSAADAVTDLDGDRVGNRAEYRAGTNPQDPLSFPVLVNNDFGGDGKSDVLLRNKITGEWYMAELNGTTILGQSIVSGPFLNVNHVTVATGDFDGDGDADILTRGTASGLIPGRFRVELTDGRTYTGAAWINTMSSNLNDKIIATRDFNDDGRADVLLRNSSTGVWTLNLMNGTGAPAIGTLNATTSLAYTFKGDGDYDGNGYPDLLLRADNGGDGTWMVVELDGDFTIKQSGFPSMAKSSSWQPVVTDKDFNGDGREDVLIRQNSGTVRQWFVYMMDGVSAPSDSGLISMATSDQWQIASDADFNADGKADIMLRSTLTGEWYSYLLNGKAISSSGLINMVIIKDWELKTIDDHNGDGKGDILLRDKVTGQWLMHLMNGLVVQQKSTLPIVYSLNYELQNK